MHYRQLTITVLQRLARPAECGVLDVASVWVKNDDDYDDNDDYKDNDYEHSVHIDQTEMIEIRKDINSCFQRLANGYEKS